MDELAGSSARRLVSAPLEVLGASTGSGSNVLGSAAADGQRAQQNHDAGIALHVVPGSHPHIDQVEQQASTASCCLHNTLVTATASPRHPGLVELRTFLRNSTEADSPPHHILLPAPVLYGIHLRVSKNHAETVVLQACTITGLVYRIALPLQTLASIDKVPQQWISLHRIAILGNDEAAIAQKGTLSLSHVSNDGSVTLIACNDGRIVKVVWEEADVEAETSSVRDVAGQWRESILQAYAFFSRIFARGSQASSPSQVSSMATYMRSKHWSSTIALVVSHDRKLRIWDLGTDACIRVIDLPASASDPLALAKEEDPEREAVHAGPSASLKCSHVQAFSIENDASGAYAVYILLYMPALLHSGDFLVLYGLQLTNASSSSSRQFGGSVGDIDLLLRKRCDKDATSSDCEFRDVAIVPQGSKVNIWTLLATPTGQPLLNSCEIFLADETEAGDWQTTSLPCSYSPLQGVALDDDMSALTGAEEIAPFMIARITEPMRFSRSSLDYALSVYEDILEEREAKHEHLLPATFEQMGLAEQIVALVAITINIVLDPSSGAPRHEEYFAAVKREWSTFVGLLQEHDAQERWPIGFVRAETRQHADRAPSVISSGYIGLAVEERPASQIWRQLRQTPSGSSAPVLDTLKCAQTIDCEIHPRAWIAFELDLLETIRLQSTNTVEKLAMDAWDSHIASLINGELVEALRVQNFTLKSFGTLQALIKELSSTRLHSVREKNYSELESALIANAVCQSIADRLNIARLVLKLALAAQNGLVGSNEVPADMLDLLIANAVAALQKYRSFELAAHSIAIPAYPIQSPIVQDDDADAQDVETQMQDLKFGHRVEEQVSSNHSSATNIIHLGIVRGYLLGASEKPGDFLATIESACLATLDMLAPDESSASVDISARDLLFAHRTLQEGHPEEALAFINCFPDTFAGDFIKGRAHLAIDDLDGAAKAFQAVASFLSSLTSTSSDAVESASLLHDVLPHTVSRRGPPGRHALRFYQYVIASFQQAQSPKHVVDFAQRAVKLLELSPSSSVTMARAVHLVLFQSYLMLWRFEEAYMELVILPFDDLQRECLRNLISVMCEKGFVDQLLSLNFAGLQSEVERTLSFKARNSDPLADGINYYDVLFAFHVRRGDLKSAGATMWQLGKRINDLGRRVTLPSRNVYAGTTAGLASGLRRQHVILEAQCFLKSINVLSLIAPADAWFAYEMSGLDEDVELIESSKLTSFVPKPAFHKEAHEIRIVYLDDIRRHYQILVAYLELATLWPEDSIPAPTSSSGIASAFAMLFVQTQDFERAFTFAHNVDADREQIYRALTDKCLESSKWLAVQREEAKQGKVEEHPVMRAFFDDDVTAVHNEREGVVRNDLGHAPPNARFLDRADRTVGMTGPSERRASRYLRFWLSLESGQGASRYRVIVFEHILARQQRELAPAWLIRWLRKNRPDALVKGLFEHDYIISALQEAIEMVKSSTGKVVDAAKPPRVRAPAVPAGTTWLPYLVLDELLQRAKTIEQGKDMSQSTQQRALCEELRRVVETHKEKLQRIESDECRALQDSEAHLRRLNAASTLPGHRGLERQQHDTVMGV